MKKAFTLIELLVVLAIIALLISIMIPSIIAQQGNKPTATTAEVDHPAYKTNYGTGEDELPLKILRFIQIGPCEYIVYQHTRGEGEVGMIHKEDCKNPAHYAKKMAEKE